MPSKGVICYSYVAALGCQIEYSVPGRTIKRSQLKSWTRDHLEVDKKDIKGVFNFTGTFAFRVLHNGQEIAKEWININTLTGNLEAGTMKTMEDQKSTISNDFVVCYGFYDAGPGLAGLPAQDQVYVTVTPNYSRWMGHIAPQGSLQASKPFSRLFLPSAHDIGMNSMQSADAVIQNNAIVDFLTRTDHVFAQLAGSMTHDALVAIAPNIVRGLAITQKDTLADILITGARYFEFRPSYLHNAIRSSPPIADIPYFSHSAIPGMSYVEFLHGLVSFLLSHPDEIVIVQLRWDGVPAECARPTEQDLTRILHNALELANNSIIPGSIEDMLNLNISQLREQRKRLILFMPSDSYSTYSDAGNATLNGDSILAGLKKITPELQAGKPFTNLQCQATATNIPDVVVYSVLAANATNSCLLATKPTCDNKTLPWILENGGRLDKDQLVVIMNDFFDGATADVAVEWSRRRLAL